MRNIFSDLDLVVCDNYDVNNVGFTYEGLGIQSFIGHVFLHKSAFNKLEQFAVITEGTNSSDCWAIGCILSAPTVNNSDEKTY